MAWLHSRFVIRSLLPHDKLLGLFRAVLGSPLSHGRRAYTRLSPPFAGLQRSKPSLRWFPEVVGSGQAARL